MKERVCLTKKCPLRHKDNKTGEMVCIAGQDAKGYFVQPVYTVKETDCISRRSFARKEEKK